MATFYHTVPNSVIHIMRGESYCEPMAFTGGRLDVDDDDKPALDYLNAIADKPGCPISSKGKIVDKDALAAAEMVQQNAAKVIASIAGAKPGQV